VSDIEQIYAKLVSDAAAAGDSAEVERWEHGLAQYRRLLKAGETPNADCYCVCHSSCSSRSWCKHCKGDNVVGWVPRCQVSDESNVAGVCARALPCQVHELSEPGDRKLGRRGVTD
jgi:hypothetical protein